ncbi:MAG: Rieske 2Fe-2S domain-containing protein [Gammaproteobacteria bacterium]|nr:Rieske 2Fe-2S domain-containing protein [Gammaproteobacteria bacterium]
MQHEKQVALIRSLHEHIDRSETCLSEDVTRIPVQTYTSASRLAAERDVLFGAYPLVMALSHELPEPGTFITHDRAGVPVLVARGADGAARAFLNVCRHRGAKVATQASGCVRKLFSCPYHGWSYGLDGALIHIPNEAAFTGVDKACHGLKALPTVERHGMVWVSLNADAKPYVAGFLGDLDSELAAYELPAYHLYETRIIEQPFNWKIAIDTFLEPYHFGLLHRNSIAPLFIHDMCLVDNFGPHIREVFPRKSVELLRDRPHSEWNLPEHSAIVYVLFPNTVWVMQIDHVELWRIYPDANDPARCSMTMDFLIPEPAASDEAREHWRKNMDLLMMTVLDEDFPTGATIQQGLASGAQTHLTFGRNEPALAYFENTVAAHVRAEVAE